MLLAIELTEGMAKIASGSILVTALLLAFAAFSIKSNSIWFRTLSLIVMAGVVVLAIVLFSANERQKATDTARESEQTRECQALLSQIRQGLRDKLLFEDDVEAAKNIARSLVADIEGSKCKPGG